MLEPNIPQKMKVTVFVTLVWLFVDVCSAMIADIKDDLRTKQYSSRKLTATLPTAVHEFDFRACTDGHNVSDTYSSLIATPSTDSICLK